MQRHIDITSSLALIITLELYQYDQGIQLWIYDNGLYLLGNLWSKIQSHFTCLGYNMSINVTPTVLTLLTKHLVINIPNSILMAGNNIICYLYVSDTTSSYTLRKIEIPIVQRVKPSNVQYTLQLLTQYNTLLSSLNKVKDNYDTLYNELQTLKTEVDELSSTVKDKIANVDTAVSNANTATSSANEAASSANEIANNISTKLANGLFDAKITVGTTTTTEAGTDATVTNSGTNGNAILNFTIPKGAAATVLVGTTTTLLPDKEASVTNSGDTTNAVFNFSIPKGLKGDYGLDVLTDETGLGGTVLNVSIDDIEGLRDALNNGNVVSVNGESGIVTLTASDVGALPDTTTIPSKVSLLENDSGYMTSYTETDPTVPSWAKKSTKPTYTASLVGAVPTTRKINNKELSSDIILTASEVGALPSTTVIPDVSTKQDKLIAGSGISIALDGKTISASTGTAAFYNVVDYSFDNTGTNYCDDAWSSLYAKVADGSTVWFPLGTYKFSNTIVISKLLHITGSKNAILVFDSDGFDVTAIETSICNITLQSAKGVTGNIGIKIDGETSDLYDKNADYCRIDNVTFIDAVTGASDSNDTTINTVEASYYWGTCIFLDATWYTTVSNCQINNYRGSRSYRGTGIEICRCSNIILSNNYIAFKNTGILCSAITATATNRLEHCDGVQIIGGNIVTCSYGCRITEGTNFYFLNIVMDQINGACYQFGGISHAYTLTDSDGNAYTKNKYTTDSSLSNDAAPIVSDVWISNSRIAIQTADIPIVKSTGRIVNAQNATRIRFLFDQMVGDSNLDYAMAFYDCDEVYFSNCQMSSLYNGLILTSAIESSKEYYYKFTDCTFEDVTSNAINTFYSVYAITNEMSSTTLSISATDMQNGSIVFKKIGRLVHAAINGVITNSIDGLIYVTGTIPESYRPSNMEYIPFSASNTNKSYGNGRFVIRPNGSMYIDGTSTVAFEFYCNGTWFV